MNMKNFTLIIALSLCLSGTYAQDKTDNYSFIKLYVTNDKGEILLLGSGDSWEITGARYNDTLTIIEFVNWLGERMGIKIKNIRLRGLLTFHYSYRTNPTLMHYYTAEYESGNLVLPKGCDGIRWVKKEEAYKMIPFEEMNKIIEKINNCDYLFGGSFWITKDSITQQRSSRVKEPFYRLN